MPTTINRWPICALATFVSLRRAYGASLPEQAAKVIACAVTATALGRHPIEARLPDLRTWGQIHVSGHDVFWHSIDNDIFEAHTPSGPKVTHFDYEKRVVLPLAAVTDAGRAGYQEIEAAISTLIEGREHNNQFAEGGLYLYLRETFRSDHRINLDALLDHARAALLARRRSA